MNGHIWIGLVGIVPYEGNDSLGKGTGGAYTNVLGYADNYDDFVSKVANALKTQGFEMFEIEDVELYSDRILKFQVDNEIIELAREVESKNEYRYGKFYTFPVKGAN
jgi:hypothetical protein